MGDYIEFNNRRLLSVTTSPISSNQTIVLSITKIKVLELMGVDVVVVIESTLLLIVVIMCFSSWRQYRPIEEAILSIKSKHAVSSNSPSSIVTDSPSSLSNKNVKTQKSAFSIQMDELKPNKSQTMDISGPENLTFQISQTAQTDTEMNTQLMQWTRGSVDVADLIGQDLEQMERLRSKAARMNWAESDITNMTEEGF